MWTLLIKRGSLLSSDFYAVMKATHCDKNSRGHLFREHCERLQMSTKQQITHIYGQPQPSKKVLSVPQYGTSEAKRSGVSCLDGLVMLHLEDSSWVQALDRDNRYYTCRRGG